MKRYVFGKTLVKGELLAEIQIPRRIINNDTLWNAMITYLNEEYAMYKVPKREGSLQAGKIVEIFMGRKLLFKAFPKGLRVYSTRYTSNLIEV